MIPPAEAARFVEMARREGRGQPAGGSAAEEVAAGGVSSSGSGAGFGLLVRAADAAAGATPDASTDAPAGEAIDPKADLAPDFAASLNGLRTNQLFVTDIQGKLDEIAALIAKIDVPVRQVMIEARIVGSRISRIVPGSGMLTGLSTSITSPPCFTIW